MKKKNVSALSETAAIKSRSSEAIDLEKDRLAIIKDLEKYMKRYSRIVKDNSLTKRKYRVGKGPHDFSEEK